MIISVSKDGAAPKFIPPHVTLAFFRAFRSEMWAAGTRRDPEEGDEVLGVKIVALTK